MRENKVLHTHKNVEPDNEHQCTNLAVYVLADDILNYLKGINKGSIWQLKLESKVVIYFTTLPVKT